MNKNDLHKSLVVEVTNQNGLHARPSASFVKTANQFVSEILVEKDGETVNGKSIMGLMMLAAEKGSRLTVHATGPDAQNAITTLGNLIHSGFEGIK